MNAEPLIVKTGEMGTTPISSFSDDEDAMNSSSFDWVSRNVIFLEKLLR
jgi:hypothetical protein